MTNWNCLCNRCSCTRERARRWGWPGSRTELPMTSPHLAMPTPPCYVRHAVRVVAARPPANRWRLDLDGGGNDRPFLRGPAQDVHGRGAMRALRGRPGVAWRADVAEVPVEAARVRAHAAAQTSPVRRMGPPQSCRCLFLFLAAVERLCCGLLGRLLGCLRGWRGIQRTGRSLRLWQLSSAAVVQRGLETIGGVGMRSGRSGRGARPHGCGGSEWGQRAGARNGNRGQGHRIRP